MYVASYNNIRAMVLRKTRNMEVGWATNRLCHPSLNIKRHVLAPVFEKSKEK